MMYLIDGHNLIPVLGGHLSTLDDEDHLLRILQDFVRLSRHRVEVFFDGAPPGHAGTRTVGTVRAHFVSARTTADAAIADRLHGLKERARQVTVVSSDRQVISEARVTGATPMTSDDFARLLRRTLSSPPASPRTDSRDRPALSCEEIDEWLRLFENHE
ncbi:NYN domain-containing protein [Anaerolinea thermolimosa]|nr:NYN domain-containing protein [Anaerolinea thermolimosa]